MSWYNPTPEEARDSYYYYRNLYNEAANDKRVSERREEYYYDEKRAASSQLNTAKSQKLNFEKRLEGLSKIIGMMEGSGGWFSTNVPESINNAVKKLKTAADSYKSCIQVTGGAAAASLDSVFAIQSVEAESHSNAALSEFKREKARIEQELENLKKNIAALEALIGKLGGLISQCNAEQAALRSRMYSYSYYADHYWQYF